MTRVVEPGGRVPPDRESRASRLRRWLRPGIGVKRWLAVVFLGELLLALAGALVIRLAFRDVPADSFAGQLFDLVSLQSLPLALRPAVVLIVGLGIFLYGCWRLLGVLLEPFPARSEPLVELIYQKRSLARGPRIVAIGGGTGLSTLLRGLKESTSNITAVVTVADDGGSSGMLRQELGLPPVGDLRNCIAALADAEPAMTRLLQYRFPKEKTGSGVSGHAFGNLLIAALSAIEGDFEEGVRQSNRVLAVRGRVLPVAPVALTLHAELADGRSLEGQSVIARARGIRRVWITPSDVSASEEAIAAIGEAELIVLGPGSLYTSLLPSLLVPRIRAALEEAAGLRVYVANVATQLGETEGYSLAEHLAALHAHGVGGLIDVVVANDNTRARTPAAYASSPVMTDVGTDGSDTRVVFGDVVDDDNAHHHDPQKLAGLLLRVLEERSTPRTPQVARTA
ncbi:MAG TPA: gluconeogenesis factor YvcK family protein [Candidatus Limnocylindrales bacterium]|nr:gluconeogenesis factor YvcK family protein [Candidatus Limnocylindrales bacterium]